jgi:oligoendopeptidase F
VAAFEARRDELVSNIPEPRFLDLVRQLEAISRIAYRIYNFAALSFSADTQDQSAQSFLAQVQQQMALMENRTLFFSLWWKDLDNENATRLMAASGDYRISAKCAILPHTHGGKKSRLQNTTGVAPFQPVRCLPATSSA